MREIRALMPQELQPNLMQGALQLKVVDLGSCKRI